MLKIKVAFRKHFPKKPKMVNLPLSVSANNYLLIRELETIQQINKHHKLYYLVNLFEDVIVYKKYVISLDIFDLIETLYIHPNIIINNVYEVIEYLIEELSK